MNFDCSTPPKVASIQEKQAGLLGTDMYLEGDGCPGRIEYGLRTR